MGSLLGGLSVTCFVKFLRRPPSFQHWIQMEFFRIFFMTYVMKSSLVG